jgi:polyisoprenoid-binding protein YceI
MHSEVQSKVKQLMISTITGDFKAYDTTAENEDAFKNAQFNISTQNGSILTGNEQRYGR